MHKLTRAKKAFTYRAIPDALAKGTVIDTHGVMPLIPDDREAADKLLGVRVAVIGVRAVETVSGKVPRFIVPLAKTVVAVHGMVAPAVEGYVGFNLGRGAQIHEEKSS